MPKKNRKRPRPSSNDNNDDAGDTLSWRTVEVGLLAPSEAASGIQQDDEDYDTANNHYDQPSSRTYRSADRELEADPSEGVGMFFGLEVLDGSQYTVVEEGGNKRIVPKRTENKHKDDNETSKEAKWASAKPPKEKEPSPDSNDCSTGEAGDKGEDEAGRNKKKMKNRNKKKRKNSSDIGSSEDDSENVAKKSVISENEADKNADTSAKEQKPKKDKKTKTKNPKEKPGREENNSNDDAQDNNPLIQALQNSWLTATGGVTLSETLCKSLLAQNFWNPTPIQAASLPAAVLGRRNIVGAAPTGSGKTLAYLLPILEYLLLHEEMHKLDRKLRALILAPTRELALQVQKECNKLVTGKCDVLVGGLALQKQERVLRKNKPPIIIATPGRLWEMISSREHKHLNDLSQLAFLVIDECDRMTEQGSFPQFHRILDAVEKANPMDSDDEEGEDIADDAEADADDNQNRLLSLPGVRGEAKVVWLNDELLSMMEKQKSEVSIAISEAVEVDDDEFNQLNAEEDADENLEMDEDEISLPTSPPVQRQTFVYSATLTLPPSDSYIPSRNKRRKAPSVKGLEGAIAEILEKARARGKTKVIDLSNSKKQAKFNESILESKEKSKREKKTSKQDDAPRQKRSFNLPPGLMLQEIKCTQMHKDSHLYAYLLTTREGASGPCLVFCNSIKGVRRVGMTLKTLGLPVRMLHASMQQRARFRSVESLQSDSRAVVVATDIAARGLDIPNVATVVHYDVARKVDGFVHRAGRTARGMGEKAVGSSLSLISPAEDKAHRQIVGELNVSFEHVHLDARLLAAAQERANLASKIILAEEVEGKARRNNQWFLDSAKNAGLDIDDEDVLDEGLAGGNLKEQQQLREAQRAKGILQRLLAEPLVTQRFGKFLSCNSAARQVDVAPYVSQVQSNPPKKKRKKS